MRKFSKAQETYMLAKDHLETLEEQESKLDHQYIIDNNIKNPDGSTPEFIDCIEDDEVFEKANENFSIIVEYSGLWAEILEARRILKQAEQNLINWGFTVVKNDLPRDTFNTLQRGMSQYKIRQKMIELTLKLAI